MRVSKRLIEELKGYFGLLDWSILVRISPKDSDACGTAHVRTQYKTATITLYPKAIRMTRETYPNENWMDTLLHEFSEVAMASYEGTLPDEIVSDKRFVKYQDACADHFARAMKELIPR